jgi:hypothetical protein
MGYLLYKQRRHLSTHINQRSYKVRIRIQSVMFVRRTFIYEHLKYIINDIGVVFNASVPASIL